MTKRELRILFINHPAAKEIIETHFYDVFSYVDSESLYWNQINFTEDYSYYISFLSTSPLIDTLLERTESKSFELVIGHHTLCGSRWANVPTHIIVSTVEQFEMILSMVNVELVIKKQDENRD